MKKTLSILLSILVVVLAIAPFVAGAVTAKAGDAYAVIFTASDFQDDSAYSNLTARC